jgi:DNA modification methylase
VQDWSYDYWISDLTFSDGLIHPCPRPMDLCEVIVRNWTVETGIILDAFTGSGQIPLAVVTVGGGRKFVAIEVVPEYATEAERRLIEATGG